MKWLRLFMITASGGVYAAWAFFLAVEGLRTGRVRHNGAPSTYSRKNQPIRFFLEVAFYLIFGVLCLLAVLYGATKIWRMP